MSFDLREARVEILELFAEAQHLGARAVRIEHVETEGSRALRASRVELKTASVFVRATMGRVLELGICLACGSRAPDHACPLETPPPRFLQLFKQPTSYRSWLKPKGCRPAPRRQFPPHVRGYRCPVCRSESNAHLCPG